MRDGIPQRFGANDDLVLVEQNDGRSRHFAFAVRQGDGFSMRVQVRDTGVGRAQINTDRMCGLHTQSILRNGGEIVTASHVILNRFSCSRCSVTRMKLRDMPVSSGLVSTARNGHGRKGAFMVASNSTVHYRNLLFVAVDLREILA